MSDSIQRGLRPSWLSLMGAAAIVEAALLIVTGVGLSDVETIAFAMVVSVSSAWFLWRRGPVPVLVRSLVFLDVLFFMATATVANLSTHEGFGAIVLPLALTITSAVGVIASSAYLVAGRGARGGAKAAGIVAVVAVLLFVVGAGASVTSPSDPQRSRAGDLTLSAHNVKFSSTQLTAATGEVSIYVSNDDLFWHAIAIDRAGIDVRIPVKGHRRVTFRASPGIYEFYCSIPGHAGAGMKGTLTVH